MSEANTVEKILKRIVRTLGGDGLVDDDGECGCRLQDLAPCGHMGMDCAAARLVQCQSCKYDGFVRLSDSGADFMCSECGAWNTVTQPPEDPEQPAPREEAQQAPRLGHRHHRGRGADAIAHRVLGTPRADQRRGQNGRRRVDQPRPVGHAAIPEIGQREHAHRSEQRIRSERSVGHANTPAEALGARV